MLNTTILAVFIPTFLFVSATPGMCMTLSMTLGMTVVLGLLIWALAKLVALPVVGEYFADAQDYVKEYVDKTDYKGELVEMNRLLQEINENLKQ